MTIPYISSVQNQLIKDLIKLRDAKERYTASLFMAEGVRTCTALCNSKAGVKYLIVTYDHLDLAETMVPSEKIVVASDSVINKLSSATTPSGMIGVFTIPEQPSYDTISQGIVIAQISDPGNMGTLIRTAAALNMRSVVIIEGTDPWGPKVIQATAGVMGMVDIFRISWDQLQEIAVEQKIILSALVVENGIDPRSISYPQKHLFVVGNEAHGIPELWAKACANRVSLPMPGGTESFNAAIAGSLALYVAYLQQHPYQVK